MDAQAAAVAVDADSRRGRFGWVEVNQLFVPFVFRGEERTKWCGVRVAERLVLGALLGVPRAALECAAVDAVTMTKAEAELHNEINTKHLNSKMGKEMFTMTDAMVRLCDLQQLVIFLKFCQRRLAGQEVVAAGRCGFKRIQAEEEASDVAAAEEEEEPEDVPAEDDDDDEEEEVVAPASARALPSSSERRAMRAANLDR